MGIVRFILDEIDPVGRIVARWQVWLASDPARWRRWLPRIRYEWRDLLVPGWTELRAFVDEWMAAPPDAISRPAFLPDEDAPTDPSPLIAPSELTDEGVVPQIPAELPAQPITRPLVAYRHLGGRGIAPERLRWTLQCVGSLSAAFRLVHRDRELTDDERQRFASHTCPPERVTWQYIASGTAGALGALYMLPQGVEE